MKKIGWMNLSVLTFGFAFLYMPMILLVIFSFNESRLVTVWAGFSTKWYGELLQNDGFLQAASITLKVAFFSATLATILGTMAAFFLVRNRRFWGRSLYLGMIISPLVIPEVITGLALLLLFIAIGLDRGILTVMLAHITFSLCYVCVVVSSRLMHFDVTLEEAALDLGCNAWGAFTSVTLPLILPGVLSGWLLAFTLSLDDLVIAAFTTGPSATTLPIKIFSSIRLGVTPEINALSSLLIGMVTIGVIVTSLSHKYNILGRQRRENDENGEKL